MTCLRLRACAASTRTTRPTASGASLARGVERDLRRDAKLCTAPRQVPAPAGRVASGARAALRTCARAARPRSCRHARGARSRAGAMRRSARSRGARSQSHASPRPLTLCARQLPPATCRRAGGAVPPRGRRGQGARCPAARHWASLAPTGSKRHRLECHTCLAASARALPAGPAPPTWRHSAQRESTIAVTAAIARFMPPHPRPTLCLGLLGADLFPFSGLPVLCLSPSRKTARRSCAA